MRRESKATAHVGPCPASPSLTACCGSFVHWDFWINSSAPEKVPLSPWATTGLQITRSFPADVVEASGMGHHCQEVAPVLRWMEAEPLVGEVFLEGSTSGSPQLPGPPGFRLSQPVFA